MAVADRIFDHARRTPDKTALVLEGERISYGEFAHRIAAMRQVFASQDLDFERVAAIFIRDRLEQWVVGLALRSLGVTTIVASSYANLGVPLTVVTSPGDDTPELRRYAEATDSPLIVTQSKLQIDALVERGEAATQVPRPGGHILMSSGTTGTPKMAVIDAANEERNAPLRAASLGLSAASVVNIFAFEGWTALGYQWPVCVWRLGGTAVMLQRWESEHCFGCPATHALIQPQMLRYLLGTYGHTATRDDGMTLLVGGGALSPPLWHSAREHLTDDVRTIVGSTEIGTFAITRPSTPEDLPWHRVHPGFKVEVVDHEERPLPPGSVGALRIQTTGVDRYLNDPAATDAVFRGGAFYPGDLAVWRPDGAFSLQGRTSDVINISGRKTATAPMEAELEQKLGAAGVCLLSLPEDGQEVIHLVIQPERPIDGPELEAAAKRVLVGAELVRVHQIDVLPRNQMGKIDRLRLRAQLLSKETLH